jgi:hypothetical protein
MKISRYFSTEGTPVVQQVKWKTIPEVKVEDGLTKEVIFSAKNVEVPEHWSDNAAGILANKYFRKAGVPRLTYAAGICSRSWSWVMPNWLYPRMPTPQSETNHLVLRLLPNKYFTVWLVVGHIGVGKKVC